MRFFMEDLGFRRLQLTKLIQRSPQVMGNSVEKMRVNVRGRIGIELGYLSL